MAKPASGTSGADSTPRDSRALLVLALIQRGAHQALELAKRRWRRRSSTAEAAAAPAVPAAPPTLNQLKGKNATMGELKKNEKTPLARSADSDVCSLAPTVLTPLDISALEALGGGSQTGNKPSIDDSFWMDAPPPLPKLQPPPGFSTPQPAGRKAAPDDALGALWTEMSAVPKMSALSASPPAPLKARSLKQLAEEKKQAQTARALREGVHAIGRAQTTSDEHTRQRQHDMERRFTEREVKRAAIEAEERRAAEEAAEAERALTAKYRFGSNV